MDFLSTYTLLRNSHIVIYHVLVNLQSDRLYVKYYMTYTTIFYQANMIV